MQPSRLPKVLKEKPVGSMGPSVSYEIPDAFRDWNGLILVGEAPGAEETKLGRPFVGRSGQLLDKILIEAGIERKRTIIANVFRMQPPGNKVDHFFISKRAAAIEGAGIDESYGKFGSNYCRSIFAPEIQHLAAILAEMKKSFPGLIVVALGRTPLWALTGESGLLSKVGQQLTCRLAENIPVIPTFHPSFILRGNWGLQKDWLSHFATAKSFLK